jgi:hypothetical protein
MANIGGHGLARPWAGDPPRASWPLLALLAGGLLVAAAPRADAQSFAGAVADAVRVEWTADPPKGKWQRVCGHIYNDATLVTREVQLLVEGRDPSDRVIDSRRTPVFAYIAPRGRTYFCSTAAAGAARYSVTVVGIQWGGER